MAFQARPLQCTFPKLYISYGDTMTCYNFATPIKMQLATNGEPGCHFRKGLTYDARRKTQYCPYKKNIVHKPFQLFGHCHLYFSQAAHQYKLNLSSPFRPLEFLAIDVEKLLTKPNNRNKFELVMNNI